MQLTYQGREIPGREDIAVYTPDLTVWHFTTENINEISPWFDLRVPPLEAQLPSLESMIDRRQLKSHLPLDALVFSPKAKYIYIGRDGRDCYMSLYNHYKSGNDLWYHVLNDTPGLHIPMLILHCLL